MDIQEIDRLQAELNLKVIYIESLQNQNKNLQLQINILKRHIDMQRTKWAEMKEFAAKCLLQS